MNNKYLNELRNSALTPVPSLTSCKQLWDHYLESPADHEALFWIAMGLSLPGFSIELSDDGYLQGLSKEFHEWMNDKGAHVVLPVLLKQGLKFKHDYQHFMDNILNKDFKDLHNMHCYRVDQSSKKINWRLPSTEEMLYYRIWMSFAAFHDIELGTLWCQLVLAEVGLSRSFAQLITVGIYCFFLDPFNESLFEEVAHPNKTNLWAIFFHNCRTLTNYVQNDPYFDYLVWRVLELFSHLFELIAVMLFLVFNPIIILLEFVYEFLNYCYLNFIMAPALMLQFGVYSYSELGTCLLAIAENHSVVEENIEIIELLLKVSHFKATAFDSFCIILNDLCYCILLLPFILITSTAAALVDAIKLLIFTVVVPIDPEVSHNKLTDPVVITSQKTDINTVSLVSAHGNGFSRFFNDIHRYRYDYIKLVGQIDHPQFPEPEFRI